MARIRKINCEFTNSDNQKVYLLSSVLEHIGKLLNLQIYDLYASHDHFPRWCEAYGNNNTDKNVLFQAYKNHPHGEKVCPPYIAAVDIFAYETPELFPIEYVCDLEGTEICFDIDDLISTVQTDPRYAQKDKDKILVAFFEKMKEVYGKEVYFCEQET